MKNNVIGAKVVECVSLDMVVDLCNGGTIKNTEASSAGILVEKEKRGGWMDDGI